MFLICIVDIIKNLLDSWKRHRLVNTLQLKPRKTWVIMRKRPGTRRLVLHWVRQKEGPLMALMYTVRDRRIGDDNTSRNYWGLISSICVTRKNWCFRSVTMGLHPGALHPPRKVVSVATDKRLHPPPCSNGLSSSWGCEWKTDLGPQIRKPILKPSVSLERHFEDLWGCWNGHNPHSGTGPRMRAILQCVSAWPSVPQCHALASLKIMEI